VKSCLAAILILLMTPLARGQFRHEPATPFSLYLIQDESVSRGQLSGGYAEAPQDTVSRQKPTLALFKSMLVPGWGQIGNHQYVKAGAAIALESVLIGAIVHWAGKTGDAKNAFDNSADTLMRGALYKTYLDYKDKRNYYSWLLGTTIFISMFDAYVEAHLAGFPKENEEGLSFKIEPADGKSLQARLSYRF